MIQPDKNKVHFFVIALIALFIMLVAFKWNIYSIVLSKIIFAGAICILNGHDLRVACGYVQEYKRTFVIPTIAAVIMSLLSMLVHLICELFIGARIATVISILVAVLTYAVSLVLLGGISRDEMLALPKGQTLLNICRKMHLMRE